MVSSKTKIRKIDMAILLHMATIVGKMKIGEKAKCWPENHRLVDMIDHRL